MSRVEELKQRLGKAEGEILALLATGPKMTGEYLEELGHSGMSFMLTKMIGDEAGEYDGSPHQLALSDLIDKGEVQWHYDEKLNVVYGLKGTWPVDECGKDSTSMFRIETFLDAVANKIGDPRYTKEGDCSNSTARIQWAIPCSNVREIDNTQVHTSRSIHCDGEKVRVIDYDFIVGAGRADEIDAEFNWPDCENKIEEVANALLEALAKDAEDDD